MDVRYFFIIRLRSSTAIHSGETGSATQLQNSNSRCASLGFHLNVKKITNLNSSPSKVSLNVKKCLSCTFNIFFASNYLQIILLIPPFFNADFYSYSPGKNHSVNFNVEIFTDFNYFACAMKYSNPILIIEDDPDDCELIQSALSDIGVKNEQKCFRNGQEALEYLQSTNEKTFLILSDVNMPILNGLELKRKINTNDKLRTQSIPFVFLSTSTAKKDINTAYDLLAQGFFTKPNKFDDLIELLTNVTNYWETAKHPLS